MKIAEAPSSCDAALVMRRLNTAISDMKLQMMRDDPGLLEAWTEAQKSDPDIGFLDVAVLREEERESAARVASLSGERRSKHV